MLIADLDRDALALEDRRAHRVADEGGARCDRTGADAGQAPRDAGGRCRGGAAEAVVELVGVALGHRHPVIDRVGDHEVGLAIDVLDLGDRSRDRGRVVARDRARGLDAGGGLQALQVRGGAVAVVDLRLFTDHQHVLEAGVDVAAQRRRVHQHLVGDRDPGADLAGRGVGRGEDHHDLGLGRAFGGHRRARLVGRRGRLGHVAEAGQAGRLDAEDVAQERAAALQGGQVERPGVDREPRVRVGVVRPGGVRADERANLGGERAVAPAAIGDPVGVAVGVDDLLAERANLGLRELGSLAATALGLGGRRDRGGGTGEAVVDGAELVDEVDRRAHVFGVVLAALVGGASAQLDGVLGGVAERPTDGAEIGVAGEGGLEGHGGSSCA